MTVRLRLIRSRDDEVIGEGEYASVPQIGSQVMFLKRDWEIYGVDGVRLWPSSNGPDDDLIGIEPRPPAVDVYVTYGGTAE